MKKIRDKNRLPARSKTAAPSQCGKAAACRDGDLAAKWHISEELFPPPCRNLEKMLRLFPDALQKARPLKAARKQALANDIRQLSHQLTEARSNLALPYWSNPGLTSAYLYYFLPWNIIRLARLFNGLKLPAPPVRMERPLLVDAGSGPLSLPIALWIAKPEWRKLPIQVLAQDSSRQALNIGRQIFYSLGELAGEKAWPINIVNCPIEKLGASAQACKESGAQPWLLTCANVLNELASRSKTRHKEDIPGAECGEEQKANLYERLLSAWNDILREEGLMALFVEPGTRHGGNAIMRLRQAALSAGFHAKSPCTHDGPCPLLGSARHHSSYGSGWCHFTFSANGAPEWLARLSTEAGLAKHSLSLSLLLLERKARHEAAPDLPIRVLSQAFAAQGICGAARYGCSEKGIGVLENAADLPSGSLTTARETGGKDQKHDYELLAPAALKECGKNSQ